MALCFLLEANNSWVKILAMIVKEANPISNGCIFFIPKSINIHVDISRHQLLMIVVAIYLSCKLDKNGETNTLQFHIHVILPYVSKECNLNQFLEVGHNELKGRYHRTHLIENILLNSIHDNSLTSITKSLHTAKR